MAEKHAVTDKGCILIVDDEKIVIESLSKSLQMENFEVLNADSYESAVKVLETTDQEIEAILCDLKMPGQSGLEVLRYVNKKKLAIPLTFLTGYATLTTCQEALRDGAFDYMLKPPKREELIMTLTHAVEQYRLRKENREMRKDIFRLVEEHEKIFDSLLADITAKEEREKHISHIVAKWKATSKNSVPLSRNSNRSRPRY